MRTRNPRYDRPRDVTLGRVRPKRSSGDSLIRDLAGTEVLANELLFAEGFTVTDDDDGLAVITADTSGQTGVVTVTDGTVTVDPSTSLHVPDGGLTDEGSGVARLEYLTNRNGAGHVPYTVSSSGTAVTLDLSTSNWFDINLSADCTFSFSNPPESGVGGEWAFGLRGAYVVSWPASVVWRAEDGTETTTAPTMSGSFNMVTLTTLDGGASYGAALDNGGGLEATITSATLGDMLRYNGSAWVNTAGRWATVYATAQRNLDLFVATAAKTIADTTTETTLFGTGQGSLTLPPDFFTAGKSLHVTARGQLSDTGTPNFTARLKLGTATISSVGPVALSGVSAVEWMFDGMLTCRTTGGSGTFISGGLIDYNNGTEHSLASGTEVTLSTTVSHALDLTWEWGTANASNTITAQESTVTVLDPNRVGVGGIEPVLTPDGDDVVEAWVVD